MNVPSAPLRVRAPEGSSTPTGAPLFIGADLGKVTTSLAVGELGDDGRLRVLETRAERHLGDPLRPFLDLYRDLDGGRLAGIAATGVYGERLGEPALGGVPEEIAQEQAAAWLYPEGPLNVVRVGGGGYSVLTRDAAGSVRYEGNERCSAGTGETVEGLCARLGRSLEEAVSLAEESPDGVTVTSRCAVFAKSELTHFANQGESHGRIFRGLFEGVARNVHSLYDKSKIDGPVILIGHGALVGPIAARIAALSDAPVEVAAHAGVFEALGALRFAAARGSAADAAGNGGAPAVIVGAGAFPADPEALVRPVRSRIGRLEPASRGPGFVTRLDGGLGAAGPLDGSAPAVLGLDLGSTGSKAALVDAATGAVLASVYRRTEGNPVEAAQALVAEATEMAPAPVVAVGLTGSGRDAAATVFRAVFPELGERLTVQNEIVAHATAAAGLDPDGGRSLSIVEIGGQDAKFINVENGRVVDADMNRVCSAGTGSFLEEQAIAHGVDDIAEFGRLAADSDGPPDLGQTCTVFVADVAAEALGDGFSRADIFAGLQHSVVRNYRSRVMGQRRLLDRVFFQGKPASDPALARTLAAVLEREVVVPADPGAMGAIGIALLAARSMAGAGPASGGDGSARSLPAIDLSRVLGARVAGRREFQCGDRDCLNSCHLELAEIDLGGSVAKIVSGGQCPKYDAVSTAGEKLPKNAPNPYRERDELLRELLEEEAEQGTEAGGPAGEAGATAGPLLGLPYAHYLIDTLPFFHTLLRRLGYRVEVLRPGRDTLAEGDRRCAAPGACAPVKLLHGLAVADVDVFFAPIFVHLPLPNAGAQTYTCPMAQGAPDMVGSALRAEGSATRVLRPVLFEREGDGFDAPRVRHSISLAMRALAESAGDDPPMPRVFDAAYEAALDAQRRFEAGLHAVGRRALAWARGHGYPVVLIAGETHVIHDAVLDAGIHELVAANGALPLPVDCFPTPDDAPGMRRVHWASAGQSLRATTAGASAGDVYPLLLGAYGCGPNSMIEHLFADLTEDWPHAVLESDGHGGKAGYVTRVQAFLHSVRRWRETAADGAAAVTAPQEGADFSAAATAAAGRTAAHDVTGAGMEARLARLDRRLPHSLDAGYDRFYFGHVGGGLGRHLAAAMRGAGFDASYVGEPDAAALRAAGAACSGKECLPYQLIWGTLCPVPCRGGAAPRRQEGALSQRRQRLPGVPSQPVPAHRADLARAPRPRRPGGGRRLQPRDLQCTHDADRLDRARRRGPAQHAALLHPGRRSRAGRERCLVPHVFRQARDDAREAPARRRHGRQRGRGLPLLRRGRGAARRGRPRLPGAAARRGEGGRPPRRLPVRRSVSARGRVGQRRPAGQARRPRPARHLRALRRLLRAPAAAPDPGGRRAQEAAGEGSHSGDDAVRHRSPGEGGERRAPVGVLERRACRGAREPPAGRAVSLRRDDPGGRRGPAHVAYAAHRRRRVRRAPRVRAGPDRRSPASA